jgi:hypothetical protein
MARGAAAAGLVLVWVGAIGKVEREKGIRGGCIWHGIYGQEGGKHHERKGKGKRDTCRLWAAAAVAE